MLKDSGIVAYHRAIIFLINKKIFNFLDAQPDELW
jgi:hypothetical protein